MESLCSRQQSYQDLTVYTGIRSALPIVMGYLPIGAAYGMLARQAGLSTAEVVAMSFIVFAGSSQFIAVGMIAAGVNTWAIVFTTFLVNLRHLLMSASLSVSMRRISRPLQALLAFWITDESFAVCSATLNGRQATAQFIAGLQVTAYLAWAGGSMAGAVLGGMASGFMDLGIDYALPAMFIALLMMQMRERLSVVVAVLSAVLSLIFAIYVPGNFNVILATLLSATVGVLLSK